MGETLVVERSFGSAERLVFRSLRSPAERLRGLLGTTPHTAQVALVGEGQLFEISLSLHIAQVDVGELLRVERRPFLQGFELFRNHVELLGLHVHDGYSLSCCGGRVPAIGKRHKRCE